MTSFVYGAASTLIENHMKQTKIKKNLGPKDKFSYKNIGYGLISYEEGSDAIGVKKGKLYTDTFDKMGMEWNGTTWVFDGGLGLRTEIATIAELKEYEKQYS